MTNDGTRRSDVLAVISFGSQDHLLQELLSGVIEKILGFGYVRGDHTSLGGSRCFDVNLPAFRLSI